MKLSRSHLTTPKYMQFQQSQKQNITSNTAATGLSTTMTGTVNYTTRNMQVSVAPKMTFANNNNNANNT